MNYKKIQPINRPCIDCGKLTASRAWIKLALKRPAKLACCPICENAR